MLDSIASGFYKNCRNIILKNNINKGPDDQDLNKSSVFSPMESVSTCYYNSYCHDL